jgi:hypothetical protein
MYKTDANHKEIVRVARQMGATVQNLAMVGHGCPDLIIGFKGINYLVEVKDGKQIPSKRALTFMEKDWHDKWNGQVAIVESINDLVHLLSPQKTIS